MKDKRKRIALFGGSFDPPHAAHIDIIFKLADKFDKVIVLPAHISPFKPKAKTAKADDRVAMLESVGFPENVKISHFELKREGVSYTYLTAAHYAQKFPDAKLYFVIGSDGLAGLEDWKNADVLAATVRFYVIGREGFAVDDARVAELEAKGFRIKVSKLTCADVSSSAVKVALAFGKTDGLDAPVVDYIRAHDLYGEYKKITDRYGEFNMKPERIEHTFGATVTGIKLAKLNGVKVDDAVRALLLHDIGKYATDEMLSRYGIEVPEEVKALPPSVQHAPIGALIAEKAFKIRKKSILDAISYHTTGKPKMSKLARVVFMADFIEPGRTFSHVDELRAVTFRKLDLGVEAGLKRAIAHVTDDGGVLCPMTVEAYEYYALRNNPALRKQRKQKAASAKEEKKNVTAEKTETKKAPKKTAAEIEKRPAKTTKVKTVEKKKPFAPPENIETPEQLAKSIAYFLSEKKGRDVRILDIRSRSVLADYFVVGGAGSSTQVKALSEYVDEKLSKGYKIEPLHRDRDAKWIAVDYGSVIMHVLTDEMRVFYQLERLWSDGSNELPL